MNGPKVSNRRLRDAQRAAHLLGGLMLGVYVYLHLIGGPAPRVAEGLMQAVVFPLVAATGLLMWQLPRLRKRLRNRKKEKGGGQRLPLTPVSAAGLRGSRTAPPRHSAACSATGAGPSHGGNENDRSHRGRSPDEICHAEEAAPTIVKLARQWRAGRSAR